MSNTIESNSDAKFTDAQIEEMINTHPLLDTQQRARLRRKYRTNSVIQERLQQIMGLIETRDDDARTQANALLEDLKNIR